MQEHAPLVSVPVMHTNTLSFKPPFFSDSEHVSEEHFDMPNASGPYLNMESPIALGPLPASHISLQTFVCEKRHKFEDFCREVCIHDVRASNATKNFHFLLKCAELASEEIDDDTMIADFIDMIIKHWDMLIKLPSRLANKTPKFRKMDDDDSDDEVDRDISDSDDDWGPGSPKKPRNEQVGYAAHDNSAYTSSGSKSGSDRFRGRSIEKSVPDLPLIGELQSIDTTDICGVSTIMQKLSLLRNEHEDERITEKSIGTLKDDMNLQINDNFLSASGPLNATTCAQAARNGQLKELKNAYKSGGCRWDERTCSFAAKQGHFKLLKWVRTKNCPWDEWTCAFAAEQGNLKILKWARMNGCPCDEWTCAFAAEMGHFRILRWAHTNGCPWDPSTCAFAAEQGHLEILKWARSKNCPWNEWTCAYAAAQGHINILDWARQNGCPWNEVTCAYSAEQGHLEVLKWVRQNGCPWNELTCAFAALNGHLDILKWARANGCPWDFRTRALAAENGHWHVVRWARANGCPCNSDMSVEDIEKEQEWKSLASLSAVKSAMPIMVANLDSTASANAGCASKKLPLQVKQKKEELRKNHFQGLTRLCSIKNM
jgi:hypothetical protein